MSEKSILTFNLSLKESNALEQLFQLDSKEVIEIKELTQLETNRVNASSAFIAIDSKKSRIDLQEILYHFRGLTTFLVLREKNFSHLMVAFKNRVEDVFVGELTEKIIDLSRLKINLKDESGEEDLPKAEIIDLFSSPLNISSDAHLLFALNNYFENFNSLKRVGLAEISSREVKLKGDVSNSLDFQRLANTKFSEKFIGEKVILNNEGILHTIAMPIYLDEKGLHWLIVEIEGEQVDYVFNDLFFRFLENVYIYKRTKESEENLGVLAQTDDVTGLYNQRKLTEDLEKAIKEHEKILDTFSIMFIDVDHFKEVNDNHGHIIGSKILTDLGKLLAEILRSSDHIYRYGGDEFVVIMPFVELEKVHEVAVRVLKQIKQHKFDIEGNNFYDMSVSIGIAEYPTDAKSAKEIIQFADDMMYKSKSAGRGKVFHLNEVIDADTNTK